MNNDLISHRSEDRISITALHQCCVKLNEEKFEIISLSTGGLGVVLTPESRQKFQIKDMVTGKLTIGKKTIEFTGEVAWISDNFMGLKNKVIQDDLSKILLDYFKAEEAALKLNRFGPDQLRQDPAGNPFWYYGPNNCELFYVEKDNEIIKLEINYFGNIINMDQDGKIVFGQIWEEEYEGNKTFRGTSLVNIQQKIDLSLFEEILRFVDSIQFLDNSHSKAIKDKLLQTS